MCQLLGMNCNVPTDICFSFTGFQARGGLTDHHRDGWGIAFFEGRGARVFLDPMPSVESPVAELVRHYPIRSLNVIAHIRKATLGEVRLENTHPFQRELWGRYWIFAHNGHLRDYAPRLSGRFLPVGDTDSELAFCHVLDTLAQRFPEPPAPAELFEALRELAAEIGAHGTFNFLLSNGERLFAHCASLLSYIVRAAPFAHAHLADQDVTVDFNDLTTPDDRVAVIATTPLTDNEQWERIPPGTLLAFHLGMPEAHAQTGAASAENVTNGA
ncbi:class II glutamine amidotransferase [Pseudothauera nasutitermitis]|uniref:Class II glutamine amidotransferase n=1 Tax=Pseudothauera nasutitermitis TaxID=2565930 RepID=A0A4S4AXF1_9RHOO|nr:class II glutamine amidotransferase [Pseudothauera nasutitermitis]THF64772.1 class II glutamine amidotransferase [Pseudothauera nasutitermitis]